MEDSKFQKHAELICSNKNKYLADEALRLYLSTEEAAIQIECLKLLNEVIED